MMKKYIYALLLFIGLLLSSCGGKSEGQGGTGGKTVEAEVVAEVTGQEVEKDAFTLHVPETWTVAYEAANQVVLQKAGKAAGGGQIGISKASTIDSLTPEEAVSAYIVNSNEKAKEMADVVIGSQTFKCVQEPESGNQTEIILMGALPNKRRVEVRLLNLSLDDPSVQEVLKSLKLR